MSAVSPPSRSYGAYAFFRFVQAILIVALAFITYTQGTSAYIKTQEAIAAKAVADNAAVKQRGEAVLLSEQAKTALETARNAAERTKSEADALEAEADKLHAEASTTQQKATYAAQQARANAMTINSEFELRKGRAFAALVDYRNIARKERAEVEKLEAQLPLARQQLQMLRKVQRQGIGAFFSR